MAASRVRGRLVELYPQLKAGVSKSRKAIGYNATSPSGRLHKSALGPVQIGLNEGFTVNSCVTRSTLFQDP